MPRLFVLLHAFVAFLLLSLFVLPTTELWKSFDVFCFTTLNGSLVGHPIQQAFWAIANMKSTDAFGALFLLGCFLIYVFEADGNERRKRFAQLLYTVIWFEISILFCKQAYTPFCEYFGLTRHSPTVVLTGALKLSEVVSWTKVKDSSCFCFPADHASIVFQWCAFLWFFAGWKRGLTTLACSTFFLLPRLISGAHWMSDLFVGSLSIITLALAWALCTPVYGWTMKKLYRLVKYNETPSTKRSYAST